MPGVLIVEAMAQTAGALVVHSLGVRARQALVYFMTIEKARFRKPVHPGRSCCACRSRRCAAAARLAFPGQGLCRRHAVRRGGIQRHDP